MNISTARQDLVELGAPGLAEVARPGNVRLSIPWFPCLANPARHGAPSSIFTILELPSPRPTIQSRSHRASPGGIFPAPRESSSYNGHPNDACDVARGRPVRRIESGTGPAIPVLARSRALASRTAE